MSPQVKLGAVIEQEPPVDETLAKSPWEEKMAEIRSKLNK